MVDQARRCLGEANEQSKFHDNQHHREHNSSRRYGEPHLVGETDCAAPGEACYFSSFLPKPRESRVQRRTAARCSMGRPNYREGRTFCDYDAVPCQAHSVWEIESALGEVLAKRCSIQSPVGPCISGKHRHGPPRYPFISQSNLVRVRLLDAPS